MKKIVYLTSFACSIALSQFHLHADAPQNQVHTQIDAKRHTILQKASEIHGRISFLKKNILDQIRKLYLKDPKSKALNIENDIEIREKVIAEVIKSYRYTSFTQTMDHLLITLETIMKRIAAKHADQLNDENLNSFDQRLDENFQILEKNFQELKNHYEGKLGTIIEKVIKSK